MWFLTALVPGPCLYRYSVALFAVITLLNPAHAGKKIYVGKKTPTDQLVPLDKLDHGAWHTLLQRYVDQDGMVNYQRLKASKPDMAALDAYINTLSTGNLKASSKRESKLAFWINAYNAVTLHGILREYPTKSIRKHTSRFGGYNIWHDYQLLVGSQTISLDSIEHKVLRKMNEPRIHFAIVCASIGCPRLLNEAYVADRLEEQLERNAKDFFTRSRNFRYDSAKRRFYLSAILDWFATDFGRNRAAQLKTIAKWLPSTQARKAAEENAVRVSYLSYDWDLNEQAK